METKTFAILLTSLIFFIVADLIRRQKMTFKYALTWLVSGLVVILFAVNDTWIRQLSEWAGFALPSNFIFFLLMIFVIVLSLLLTIYVNEQSNRTQQLAQAIAQLDYRLKKMESAEKSS